MIYLGSVAFVLLLAIPLLPGLPGDSFSASLPRTSPNAGINQDFTIGPSAGVFQSPDFYLIQKNSLKAVSPAGTINPQVLATLLDSVEGTEDDRSGIVEYLVKEGDTLSSIAEQFQISLETVLWANNLNKNSAISTGKKLVILPVSGVMHLVKPGETLGEIAKKYKADVKKAIDFNEMKDENEVFTGDIVIVPDGILPPPPIASSPVKLAPLVAGYFICPISAPCRITQGLHWYNAIDFSHGKCYEPIFAAASGKVQKVKLTASASRWAFNGAGNHLTILHPNGVVSFYGHIASATVYPGQEVSQGQIVGYVGGAYGMAGSGLSTGCHLHFQVTGAKNPFTK
ncbi:MAG: LysM peptidoglycan-binding domain-containing protein [bacterium]|nr:LysM peptidoglycan-binding domain-containing protein [bacterium]